MKISKIFFVTCLICSNFAFAKDNKVVHKARKPAANSIQLYEEESAIISAAFVTAQENGNSNISISGSGRNEYFSLGKVSCYPRQHKPSCYIIQ